jgi:hypothetical protein
MYRTHGYPIDRQARRLARMQQRPRFPRLRALFARLAPA